MKEAAREVHLKINEEETKYIPVTKKDCRHSPSHTEIAPYKFSTVHRFSYCDWRLNAKMTKCCT
jgi:hypothetical protein